MRPFNLSIDQGQVVAVVGANGAGKTTLLKIICGILKPNSGTLQIDGCSFNKSHEALQLRRMLGYAPDVPALYALDTIENYLRFIAELKQVPKAQIKERIDHSLETFDLTTLRNEYIHTLSKGMQQRVNLAQAIINQPQLLILDEPVSGLDSTQCEKFVNYLRALKQRGVTILFASHNYSDLLSLADYMLKVSNGQLQKIMLPEQTKVSKVYDTIDYTA
ncbi:MAG TPA: ABC transporter ATP-binding protein [Gammaproteobacteria bacterium]|nr:ABC transporter ATP-binding protein [Gammaproteobacteria bacterium]